jgi:putative phosphoribosyl transferase
VRFRDRTDAGRQLGEQLLLELRGSDAVVLGLPRGGVPVAAEVARVIGASLDIVVVRKLGVPSQPELAMGAVGEGGLVVWNDDVRRRAQVSDDDVAAVVARERAELDRVVARLRRKRRVQTTADGRVVIVVDDGVATGSTAIAACRVLRAAGAARIVVAVPVAPQNTLRALGAEADDVSCVHTPEPFHAVGRWYDDFTQVTDEEVARLLSGGQATAGDEL